MRRRTLFRRKTRITERTLQTHISRRSLSFVEEREGILLLRLLSSDYDASLSSSSIWMRLQTQRELQRDWSHKERREGNLFHLLFFMSMSCPSLTMVPLFQMPLRLFFLSRVRDFFSSVFLVVCFLRLDVQDDLSMRWWFFFSASKYFFCFFLFFLRDRPSPSIDRYPIKINNKRKDTWKRNVLWKTSSSHGDSL